MGLPVLVVDDSRMSRKLTIKALPASWGVDISEAANGVEALEQYRMGKAHVMFLDLTMPVMDGYQVLEHLQREGLDTFVIVVSADIQPDMQKRVMELGALAFVQKPVNEDKIIGVLKQYGFI